MVPSSFCISCISSSPTVKWCRAVARIGTKLSQSQGQALALLWAQTGCSGGSGPGNPASFLRITRAREGNMQARFHSFPLLLIPVLLKITKWFAIDPHPLHNQNMSKFGWGHSVFAVLHSYRRKLEVNHL